MANDKTEVVVLGAGPGGYPAAFEAADRGYSVTLVCEEPKPGGVCLLRGCIPSKALLHVAKLVYEAKEAAHWGVTFSEPSFDLDKLRSFKNDVIGKLTGGIRELCRSRGVNLVEARGHFTGSHSMELHHKDGSRSGLDFSKAIIATGSSPAMPGLFDIGDPRVMDSSGALELPDVPEKLLVIGGGYIGLEMGFVYSALGSKVTTIEMAPTILPGADKDLVKPLARQLDSCFDRVLTGASVEGLSAGRAGINCKYSDSDGNPQEEGFDRVLVAVGRRPNTKGFGLENTRARIGEDGFIAVDEARRTDEPHIFAIGDVAGEPMLAHKATKEGKVAAARATGGNEIFDNIAIPAVVFTDPEVAWCGIMEGDAKAMGLDVQVTRFPWSASGRARTLERPEGLTKLVLEPETGRILGVGVVGPNAGELIGEGVLAVENALTAEDMAGTIHAHPTLSETLMESAEMAHAQATHLYRPPKKR